MNMKKYLLIAVLGLAFATGANAGLSKTVSGTFGPDYTELNPADLYTPAVISVALFNTTLVNDARAVLDRVVVSFNGRLQVGAYGNDGSGHDYTGLINNPTPSTVDLRYSSTISAHAVTGTPAALSGLLAGAQTLTIDTGPQTYTTGPGTQTPFDFDQAGLFDVGLLNSAISTELSQFLGAGNLSLGFASDTSVGQIGGSFTTSDLGVMVGATLNVTYYYHDIPEPASLALIGLGILGAASLHRRGGKAA